MIRPFISTGPREATFETLDLLDKASVRWGEPIDNDVRVVNWKGHVTRIKKTVQRVIAFDCLGLTNNDAELLERWQKNRTRLRPFAGYGSDTVLYMSLQRANIDGEIECQIGPAPDTQQARFVSGTANNTYIGDDEKIYLLDADRFRFERIVLTKMHGLVLNDRVTQKFIRSHPLTGFPLWAAKTGSPTITLVDATPAHPALVDGEAKLTRIDMPASSTAYQSELLSGETGPHSAQFWVSGSGIISIDIRDSATQVVKRTSGNITLDGKGWIQVRLDNVTKGVSDAYEFVITAVAFPAVVFCAAQQLEDRGLSNPYIHNESLFAVQAEHPLLEWTTFQTPQGAGSLFVVCSIPRRRSDEAANRWVIHQENTSPNRWGFKFTPAGNYEFQLDTKTCAAGYTTGQEGLLACYGVSYDTVDLRIFENGTKENTQTINSLEIVKAGLNLGDPEINRTAARSKLAIIRIDSRKLTDTEQEYLADQWIDYDARAWTWACEGREFEIGSMALRTVDGNPDQYAGTVVLVEQFSMDSQTIELA